MRNIRAGNNVDPQRWAAVECLFREALAKEPNERSSFLENACPGDPALRSEVESLLGFANAKLRGICSLSETGAISNDAEESEHPLSPGELLMGRFQILREVGKGGMGVVYEALDTRLNRSIAIKCARTNCRDRLAPEARYASEISHPNVCKTYEIHTAVDARGQIDFITMEFIEGQSLATSLRERLASRREVETIARQLCAGLAEAHRRGVIHGDLKTNNVLVSRGPDGLRAVITDFGLARHWLPSAAMQSLAVGGTLDYMAPELFGGARPSASSDIYALGVILHELATSRTAGPLAPISHPWRRIVARCLEPDPTRRWSSVDEVSRALGPNRALRWWGVAVSAILIGIWSTIAYRVGPGQHETIRLAVLPFETDGTSRALTDGLIQEATDRLRHRETASRFTRYLKSDAKLTLIPIADAVQNHVDHPEKAAKKLGATHLLTGALRLDNNSIAIRARLTDARLSLPLKDWQARYPQNEIRNIPVALAGMVTGTLRLSPLAAAQGVSQAAYRDFTAGVGLSRRNTGVDAAIPLLQRAVALDSESPLTHARLAEAEILKYRSTKDTHWLKRSKISLLQAEQRNPDLALVRLVSGMINEYEGNYDMAQTDLQRALDLEPLNGDVWRRLGRVYQESNQSEKALSAYRRAIETQPGYFKNYQDLCSLYIEQAKYEEAVEQCRRVTQLAPDLSDAHFALAIPYCLSERTAECEAELRLALKLDPGSTKALQSLAVSLFYQSRFDEAIFLFSRAIEGGPATIDLYVDLGTSLELTGRTAEAWKEYQKGIALAENELQINPRDAFSRSALALLCARLHQRGRAGSEAMQAWRLATGSAEIATMLVRTYEVLGNRERALELIQDLPDSAIRVINRSPDLTALRGDSRFKQFILSRHIP